MINALKGIHPGKIIGMELKKRSISQRDLAKWIDVHYQTLNAVIKGKRSLTVGMSVKIDDFLGYEDGFLNMLQGYYDVRQYHAKQASETVSGIPDVRRILFWDTDFDCIDWGKSKKFVISRILERGNEDEKREIAKYYGLRISDIERFRNKNLYSTNNSFKALVCKEV